MKSRKGFRLLFPDLQRRHLGLLALCSLIGSIICTSLATIALVALADRMPNDQSWVLTNTPRLMGMLFASSLAVSLPAFLLMGAYASMPLFGALHRVHRYMEQVAAGETSQELKLRTKDPLQDLAETVNEVTRPARQLTQLAVPAQGTESTKPEATEKDAQAA